MTVEDRPDPEVNITVADLLAGKKLDRPPTRSDATFAKAPRVRAKGKQTALPTD